MCPSLDQAFGHFASSDSNTISTAPPPTAFWKKFVGPYLVSCPLGFSKLQLRGAVGYERDRSRN